MKRLPLSGFIFLLIFACLPLVVFAQQAPTVAWDKTFGGGGRDYLSFMLPTTDGGFIVGGTSTSAISGDRSQASRGSEDYWIVKIDANGNKQWDRAYGGQFEDELRSIAQTSDGGYILAGNSRSGKGGEVSQVTYWFDDYWIVKIDSIGNKIWDKKFIGYNRDFLYTIKQTADGGFILGGSSDSPMSGAKSEPNRSNPAKNDFWIIKINSNGDKLWDKTFGGSEVDDFYSLDVTSDGGYILGGTTYSGISGDKSQPSQGEDDYWVVKLDANGNKLWDRTFGGTQHDHLTQVLQTSDGGYILAGSSNSGISGNKTTANKGMYDFWIIKLDGAGNKLWEKSIGGNALDDSYGIEQAADGGYLLSGNSTSGIGGDKTEPPISGVDFWIVKLDPAGNKEWDKTVGGNAYDASFCIKALINGQFIVGGSSNSGISGNKTQSSIAMEDYWLVKFNAPCTKLTAKITSECIVGGTNLKLEISSIQNVTGKHYWTLNYTENGVSKTIADSVSARTLAYNPAPGTVFSLVSIVSGTCTTNLNQTITMPAFPAAPIANSVKRCGSGSVTFSASGAQAGSKYVWYNAPTNGMPLHTDSTGKFTSPEIQEPTLYYVAAQNKLGCEGPRTQVLVTLNNCPPVYIPNIITQNHDGKNETFQPQNLPEGNWNLQVFNRWGKKVYEKANYQNIWPEEKVKAGTYYYLLRNPETGEQFKGWVEVNE